MDPSIAFLVKMWEHIPGLNSHERSTNLIDTGQAARAASMTFAAKCWSNAMNLCCN